MAEAFRDLLASAAQPPTRSIDPAGLRRRARRRRHLAGAGVGGAGVVVALVLTLLTAGSPASRQVTADEPLARAQDQHEVAESSIPPVDVGEVVTAPEDDELEQSLPTPEETLSGAESQLDPVSAPSPRTALQDEATRTTSPDAAGGSPAAPQAPGSAPAPAPTPSPEPEPTQGDAGSTPTEPSPEGTADPQPQAGEQPAEDTTDESPSPEPTTSQPGESRIVPLPTHNESVFPDMQYQATVVGDGALEGGCVWLVIEGRARAVRWESGSVARFTAQADGRETFEVLNSAGRVVAREGQQVTVVARQRVERLNRCHVSSDPLVWSIALR